MRYRGEAFPTHSGAEAYQCAAEEKSSHPSKGGAPPIASSRRQAHSVHCGGRKFTHPTKEEELTDELKRRSSPIPPHQRGSLTQCTKEETSPPSAPKRKEIHPSFQRGGAYPCTKEERPSHPCRGGIPAHCTREETNPLTNALKRRRPLTPPKGESHPVHQGEHKPI